MLDTVLRKSLTPVNSAFRVDTVRMMPIFQLNKLRLRKVSDLHRFTELVSGQEEFYCTIFPQSWSRNIANPKVTGFEYHPNTASKQSLGKGLVLTSMPELVPLSHVHWLLLPRAHLQRLSIYPRLPPPDPVLSMSLVNPGPEHGRSLQ